MALASGKPETHAAAREELFFFLDSLETRLGRSRYLLGQAMHYVDLRASREENACALRWSQP